VQLDELASAVRALGESVSESPQELERLYTRRLDMQKLLKVTEQPDVAALRAFIETQRELAGAGDIEARIAALTDECHQQEVAVRDLAASVSAIRQESARRLSHDVTDRLRTLGLDGASFQVLLEQCELGIYGAEDVGFALQTANVPVALGAGVSGGEMSRIALALECALAGADPVPVMVFDEIDAGIGGTTAHEVASALRDLARTTQVIVVTHLPQVAAVASQHLQVSRDANGTHVTVMSGEARVDEVARMLGEAEGANTARALAAEFLARAVSREI
jgi:DNA repair protein RecN (Recombination protein N)